MISFSSNHFCLCNIDFYVLIQSMKDLLMGLIQYIFMARYDLSCVESRCIILDFISDEMKRAVECFLLNGSARFVLYISNSTR